MALNPEYKKTQMDYIAKQGGNVATSDLDAYMKSTGIQKYTDDATRKASEEGRITTSGIVKPGTLDKFEKAVQAGETGSQYIEAPQTYAKVEMPKVEIPTGTGLSPAEMGFTETDTMVTEPTVETESKIDTGVLELPKKEPETPKLDLQQQIADKAKDARINAFKTAYEQSIGRLGQEEAALTPKFLERRRQVETESAMGQRRAELARQMGGLGQSGAVGQDVIAQNVARMGAISGLSEQESAERADIQRRITEAQLLRDQGIAGAESDAELAMLQARLDDLTMKENQARLDEQTAKADYLSTIGRFGQDYQAEIDRVTNDGDPSNDWQIPYLQAARQNKIVQGNLDPVTGQPLTEGATYSIPQALEAVRLGIVNDDVLRTLNMTREDYDRMTASQWGGVGGTGANIGAEDITQQYSNYIGAWSNYFGPGSAWANDPQGLLNTLTRDQTLRAQLGDKYYQQLLSDAQSFAQGYQPPEPEPAPETNLEKGNYVSRLTAKYVTPARMEDNIYYDRQIDVEGLKADILAMYQSGELTEQEATELADHFGL